MESKVENMPHSKDEVIAKAMEEAGNILGADPAYFGEEGEQEVNRQLEKMGYNLADFLKE